MRLICTCLGMDRFSVMQFVVFNRNSIGENEWIKRSGFKEETHYKLSYGRAL